MTWHGMTWHDMTTLHTNRGPCMKNGMLPPTIKLSNQG